MTRLIVVASVIVLAGCGGGSITSPTPTPAVVAPVLPPAPVRSPVYVVIGDSIAMGMTQQRYQLPASVEATVFRKDHHWTRADDPTDLYSQVGSFWPLVIPSLPNASQWVTVGQGGTSFHQHWQPGQVSFDATVQFITESGVDHVTAFVCHLGANDVVLPETPSVDQVFADIRGLADGLATRYPGSLLYLADLGPVLTGHPPDREQATANIRTALERAWSTLPTVRRGPLMRDLTPDDGVHFTFDANVQVIAARWREALSH